MAKATLPKRIAGFKVPKGLRKSMMVKGLLGNDLGRQIVADAIVARAGAAAVVMPAACVPAGGPWGRSRRYGGERFDAVGRGGT